MVVKIIGGGNKSAECGVVIMRIVVSLIIKIKKVDTTSTHGTVPPRLEGMAGITLDPVDIRLLGIVKDGLWLKLMTRLSSIILIYIEIALGLT
jgi:hypothetical protein